MFLSALFVHLMVLLSFFQEPLYQLRDQSTGSPIPYASIVYGPNLGTVSNEEGYFALPNQREYTTIEVSSMGYTTASFDQEVLKARTLFLQPATIELSAVFIREPNLSAEEIVARALARVTENYPMESDSKRFFLRQSDFHFVRKFELHVDQSTIPGIDQQLMNAIASEVPKFSDSYKEVLGDVYGNFSKQELKLIKAANLHDPRSTESLTALTDRLETLFRENLKEKSFLKIRSGIIGFKMDASELQEELDASDAPPKEPNLVEEKQNIAELAKENLKELLDQMFWKEDLILDVFRKPGRYKLHIRGVQALKDDYVYIIEFKPKRRADFSGLLYIDAQDYGLHRLEFDNVRPLKKFSLFGISSSDDVYRGQVIYQKDHLQKYRLRYMETETGETVGVDRPLTIIEKNRHVSGRNKQNELDLDLDLRVSQVRKLQLVVYQDQDTSSTAAQDFTDFQYQKFKKYEPGFWSGYEVMEPNEAIKEFSSEERH